MRRWLPLKIAVSLAVLALLAARVDGAAVLDGLGRLGPATFLLAVAVLLAQFAVLGLRWHLVLSAAGHRIGWWQAYRLMCAAMFVNQALPTSIGADLVRVWLVRRIGVSGAGAVTTVLLDRMVGLFSLLTLLLLTGHFAGPALGLPLLAWLPWLALVAAFVALAAAGPLARLAARLGWPALLIRALEVAAEARRRWPVAIAVLLLSYATHGMMSLCLWLLSRDLGLEIGILTVLAVLPPVVLASVLPISIAGWGVREGIVVSLFALAGAPAATALAASLAWGAATLAAGLAAGGLWLLTRAPGERLRDPGHAG